MALSTHTGAEVKRPLATVVIGGIVTSTFLTLSCYRQSILGSRAPITELAESGAGDQTIMDIASHLSRQMLKHYSHIRVQAKREALDAVGKSRKRARTTRKQKMRSERRFAHRISRMLRKLKGSPYKSPYSRVLPG